MSFRNTKTPTKAEIVGKPRYQCPMHKVRNADAYYLTPELEQHFRRLYPVTMNRDMMRLFGLSFSTMQRFKRELGLQKKMKTIRHKQAQWAKRICEENGYYESMRGKQLSEACQEATRQLRASGWHPMQVVRKNKRRYQRLMAKRSEKRKELMRKERIRVDWGLGQQTNLHLPYDPYGKRRTSFKSTCRSVGYIPGKAHNPNERWIIYYTDQTKRGELREKHGIALGFKFEPLKQQA